MLNGEKGVVETDGGRRVVVESDGGRPRSGRE